MNSAVNTEQTQPLFSAREFEPGGDYVPNPFYYERRNTREVMVGSVGVGGTNPIRVQSMTVAPTLDTQATVQEAIQLFDAGCEIVRITAQGPREARNLENIRNALKEKGYDGPLVADIHFSPRAALTAVEYVDKVRINPGNFADTKMFAVRDYTDEEYMQELHRIHDSFKPLVLRAKELGRSMRIGVNHGSLSDRIMNRYGDTPRGMVESAIEFIKIAEHYDYRDIIVSMKASNPQVMIQAYRMLIERFRLENMDYPLHLGVTEAGDGKDGRMKSACGIGALLEDGLGDTIRVSLTEDAVQEIPVARALADLYNRFRTGKDAEFVKGWKESIRILNQAGLAASVPDLKNRSLGSPYETVRRKTDGSSSSSSAATAAASAPSSSSAASSSSVLSDMNALSFGGTFPVRAGIMVRAGDVFSGPVEGLDFIVREKGGLLQLSEPAEAAIYDIVDLNGNPSSIHRGERGERDQGKETDQNQEREKNDEEEVASFDGPPVGSAADAGGDSPRLIRIHGAQPASFDELNLAHRPGDAVLLQLEGSDAEILNAWLKKLARLDLAWLALDCEDPMSTTHCYRLAVEILEENRRLPLVLFSSSGSRQALSRATSGQSVEELAENAALYRTSIHSGGLLLDGIGDGILIDSGDPASSREMALDLLQTTRIRVYRTEYISCPSCGRTLFDLQETTARIKSRTGHLKGVKIAVMGCIVNGPGEMADADFGYVGSSPGKINLYRGKEVVRKNIPSEEADEALIDLIREYGMWQDP